MSDDGICGGDVPPLMGDVLTGTGLTVAQAAAGAARAAAMTSRRSRPSSAGSSRTTPPWPASRG